MIIYRVVYSNYIFCFERKNHEEIPIHQTQPVHHPTPPQALPSGNPPPQNGQVPKSGERISRHDSLPPAPTAPQHPSLPARAESGPQQVHISQQPHQVIRQGETPQKEGSRSHQHLQNPHHHRDVQLVQSQLLLKNGHEG